MKNGKVRSPPYKGIRVQRAEGVEKLIAPEPNAIIRGVRRPEQILLYPRAAARNHPLQGDPHPQEKEHPQAQPNPSHPQADPRGHQVPAGTRYHAPRHQALKHPLLGQELA